MNFKILGGKVVDEGLFYKEKHRGKKNSPEAISLTFGNIFHSYKSEWGSPNNVGPLPKLSQCEIVTDENKVNFIGAAGWGAVGGILTGGIGILAGALLGGRGKATVCAIKFPDGSQFIVQGKTKDVAKLMFEVE